MNVTGSAQLNDQLPGKHVGLMREIRPGLTRVGQLVDRTVTACTIVEEQSRQAARTIGAVLIPYPVANRNDLDRAFTQMATDRPDVLLPCPTPVLFNSRDVLFDNALRLRIPLTSFIVASVPDGVLFGYGANFHETIRAAATYVDRILKGSKPGDLPIEQPTKFELVINMKTAKHLRLAIPTSVLLRADRVIE